MQFNRTGRFHRILRVTGPTHNLLGLEFVAGAESGVVEMVDLASWSGPPTLAAEEVRRAVQEGIQAAHQVLGSTVQARAIEFDATDSPPIRIYVAPARRPTERGVRREPFEG